MARAADRSGGGRLLLSRGQWLMVALVVLGGALLGWQGYKQVYGDGSTKAVAVTTSTVQLTTLRQTATTSGTVSAPTNSKVTFAEAGRLATLNVKQGQTVQKGDVIGALDQTNLQIALAQAQSGVTTAQASVDALNNPPTPDVLSADQQSVTAAQAGITSAQQTLAQAQNSQVSANASVGNAINGVSTAQNGYSSALNTITADQTAVDTAQNNYQALLNGPTPQQIAVAQASVDAAQQTLNTAQDNYNRLINHTDIATRPETAALVSASAAYQQALANLANAQPQAANPYDVQNAQNAVQSAAAAVTTAQANAQTAQQALLQAQVTAGCDTPPYDNAALCPIGTNANPGSVSTSAASVSSSGAGSTSGQACAAPPGNNYVLCPQSVPGLSLAQQQTAQQQSAAAVTTAQNAVNSSVQQVTTAQSNYQTALTNLAKLQNPINTTDFSGQQAAVAAAKANLDTAQTNYNNYLNLTNLDIAPETTALASAQSAYNNAVASYNNTTAPAKATDLANAQNAIQTAQTQLAQAQIAANTAGTAIGTAQNAVTTAQQSANNAGSTIQTASANVPTASASLAAAQAKLTQATAPPLATDETKAQEALKQAQDALKTAQINIQHATLTAPFTGIVAAVTANVGDQVASGTEIVQLVDTSHIELDASVDETTYGQLKVGMPVSVQFDTVPNTTFTGFITAIVPNGVTAQGVVTYPIVISLNPTATGQLPPNGASASQITIILQAVPNALAVPSKYIYRDAATGAQMVDRYENGKRIPTPVTVGLASDSQAQTQILSGLKQGDVIAAPVVGAKKAGSTTGGNSTFGGGGGVPGLGGGGPVVAPGRGG
jgi:HlyD family secretion protein